MNKLFRIPTLLFPMSALVSSILVFIIPMTSYGETGLIKSSNPREPQIIIFQENPDDKDFIIYKFCLTSRMINCEIIGDISGIRKDLLLKEAAKTLKMKTFMTYFQPTASVALLGAGLGLTATMPGVLIAVAAGFSTAVGTILVYLESNDPEFLSQMSTALSTDRNGVFVLPEDISIVLLSESLEEKLNSIKERLSQDHRPILPRYEAYEATRRMILNM